MPTTINYGGGTDVGGAPRGGHQTVVIEHPRDLEGRGYPIPPRQPIANWAATLAQFEAMCTASQFREAVAWADSEYVVAGISDVPSGARTAFKAWFQANMRAKPDCLSGPVSDWRTDGALGF